MDDIERQQERGPYNVRTDFLGVRDAMAQVERGGWLRGEERIAAHWDDMTEGERSTSLEGARRWLQTVDPSEDMWRTVYGDGGVNRWAVHADGSVRFMKFYASPEGIQRAQDKGFWIE